MPEILDNKVENRRAWEEDVEDYLDSQTRGMQAFLKRIAMDRMGKAVDEEYKRAQIPLIEATGGQWLKVVSDSVDV